MDARIGRRGVERVEEREHEVAVEGVQLVGAVERQPADGADVLRQHERFHGYSARFT